MSGERPVALISGGGSGIGLALAHDLIVTHDLVLIGRQQKRLEKAAASLRAAHPARILTAAADVRDRAAIERTVDATVKTFGRLDWVIAAAGVSRPGFFAESRYEDHVDAMEVNYLGALALIMSALPHLKQGADSRLILISSGCVFSPLIGYSAYAPSKTALTSLGKILNVELSQHRIKVHLVFPPDTDTEQYREELKTRPAITTALAQSTGLWSPRTVAEIIIRGIAKNKRVIIPAKLSRLDALFGSLFWPLFSWYQRHMLRRQNIK